MNESKATRYQRGRRRAWMLGTVVNGGVLLTLVLSPAGDRVAGWALAAGQAWPAPIAMGVALALYATGIAVVWKAVWWLAAWWLVPGDAGGGPAGAGRRDLAGPLLELAGAAMIALVAAVAVQAAAWLAGPWWWGLAGVVAAAALVAALHLGPGLIARASGARAIARPALVERLGALARQVRVPIASVDELPPSASVTATALVAGAGGARRVFIAHELMRDWTDDEIAVVVAHEFGHHAHHDLWRTLAVDVAVLGSGLWAAAGVLRVAGLSADGVPVTLRDVSAVALVAGAVWLLAAPVRHALSRRQERDADVFALRLTNGSRAFQAAIRRLAVRHLAEDRPSWFARWFFHRHPTPEERLALADRFGRR